MMPPKAAMIVASLIALLAASQSLEATDTSNSGSPQMTTNAKLRPVGATSAPDLDRTRPLILAEDVRQTGPAEHSNSDVPPSIAEPPAPEPENRDFERPHRASPEAANDLFQLLKQAGPKQGPKPK
jgi:hypothetical protein